MKMIKRLAAFVAAVTFALSMSVCAFADGSPSSTGVVVSGEGTDANGNYVKIIIEMAEKITNTEALKILNMDPEDILSQVNDPNASVPGMKLIDLREVRIEGDASLVTFPLDITFKINGITADSKVSVLHFDTNTNAWESIQTTVNGDGTVTSRFNSLSPVAFFSNSASTTSITGDTSPKTGASPVIMIAVLGAIICAGGAFLLSKNRA